MLTFMLALCLINSIPLSVTLKMGTSNSRPNICKVTPKEEQPFHQAASARMFTAAQRFPHQQEILGHQKIGQLPPLKQHVPQIFSSAPGLQNLDATPIHSIIKSHPPQKAKAWQPTAHPTKPPASSNVSDEHVSMVHTCPRNVRGFLPAQTALIGQATKKRQSHRKHLREQRRIYTSSVGGDGNVEIEKIRLVSRPTQRDIFWDEMTGQNLNPRELLQSSPHLTDPDSGKKEITKHPKSEIPIGLGGNSGGFSMDLNESATKSPERKTQRRLPWLEDFRKHEQNHVNTCPVLEDGWGHYQWLEMPQGRCEKTEREMGRKTTSQVNPVQQKSNSWG